MYGNEELICPKCGDMTYQDSVDVGVGIIYGPHGCPSCGWSEDERYDCSNGRRYTEEGHMLDQFGGLHPKNGYEWIPPREGNKE